MRQGRTEEQKLTRGSQSSQLRIAEESEEEEHGPAVAEQEDIQEHPGQKEFVPRGGRNPHGGMERKEERDGEHDKGAAGGLHGQTKRTFTL